jgi:hypothetical protein
MFETQAEAIGVLQMMVDSHQITAYRFLEERQHGVAVEVTFRTGKKITLGGA